MKTWVEDDPNFIIDENNEKSIYCWTWNKSVNNSMHNRKGGKPDVTSETGNSEKPTSYKKSEFYSDLSRFAVNTPWITFNSDTWRNI